MSITLIVARSLENIIGINGTIPWYNKSDLIHFRNSTINKVVLMGRKTYDSIGKPLSDRINIVVSRKFEEDDIDNNLYFCESIEDALIRARSFNKEIMIIGGQTIYNYFLQQYKGEINLILTTINISCVDVRNEAYDICYFNFNCNVLDCGWKHELSTINDDITISRYSRKID